MKDSWQNEESTWWEGPDEAADLKTGDPFLDGWVDKLTKMKDQMGASAFNEFALKLAAREEQELRKRKPDHPLLLLLDNHRKHVEQGFF
jgi:hypothetical protein